MIQKNTYVRKRKWTKDDSELAFKDYKLKAGHGFLYSLIYSEWCGFNNFTYLSPDRGFLNSIIGYFGGEKVMWHMEAKYWPFILVFMQMWKTTGYKYGNLFIKHNKHRYNTI